MEDVLFRNRGTVVQHSWNEERLKRLRINSDHHLAKVICGEKRPLIGRCDPQPHPRPPKGDSAQESLSRSSVQRGVLAGSLVHIIIV